MFLRPLPGNLHERFAALSLLTAVRHRQTAGLDDGRRGMLCPHAPGCNQRGERVAGVLFRYGREGRSGPDRDDGQGIWRRRSPKRLSSAELFGRSPANRAPRLRGCGWNMEVEAGDYPGGDPQNGQ